jgi:hypothetical protein
VKTGILNKGEAPNLGIFIPTIRIYFTGQEP